MKTVDAILAEATETITHIHKRPTMYVGSFSRAGAANTLDEMFHISHSFWAMIQERRNELRRVHSAVCEERKCGNQHFSDAFHLNNSDADEANACHFVLECWKEVGERLGIEIPRSDM